MKQLFNILKKDTVLTVALFLGAISCFFVTPDRTYATYFDWRVLGILLSLMLVMEGLKKHGLFSYICTSLCNRTKETFQLEFVLVSLCFFGSMLITNDVALITFVPFALLTLKMCNKEERMLYVVILQTLAANLGSMLTPIGNPQNLFLFGLMNSSLLSFVSILLPYSSVSFALLLICLFFHKREPLEVKFSTKDSKLNTKNIYYIALFFLCLAVVLRLVAFPIALASVVLVTAILDRELLKKADYSLLFTFLGFFLFIGNVQRISFVSEWLKEIVIAKEFYCGVLASQVVSNVPAALLLSGFTEHYEELLLGVNVGGLGTLIASMASLISYKAFCNAYPKQKKRYFCMFTLFNVAYLFVLILLQMLLSK